MLKSADVAYSKIGNMVCSLGNPFTRIFSLKGVFKLEEFRIESDESLQGVALFVIVEQNTGNLVVVSWVEDSLATHARIHTGELVFYQNTRFNKSGNWRRERRNGQIYFLFLKTCTDVRR